MLLAPSTPPISSHAHILEHQRHRWKLSTRDRKKSLEDSLEAADYSEHHLIPVYGFRSAHDVDGAGVEERRVGLRRLEERALVAERAALERQARAEGGVGGAAFARAMSRRALAKSARIQKVRVHVPYAISRDTGVRKEI